MNWRCACIWSSLFLLPMAIMLGIAGSKLGIIYALSALASWAYHKTNEEQFVFTDHALAWTAIAANFWMAIKNRRLENDIIRCIAGYKSIRQLCKS